jgi:hypothetical protein
MSSKKVISYSFGEILRKEYDEFPEVEKPSDIGTILKPDFSNIKKIKYNPNFRKKKKNNKSKSHKKEFDKLFNDNNTN